MMNRRLDDENAARFQWHDFARIKHVACAHVQHAGYYRDVFDCRMPVRRYYQSAGMLRRNVNGFASLIGPSMTASCAPHGSKGMLVHLRSAGATIR
jgi:hypothetical protein